MVSSTKGAKSNEVTAIMMLANADSILQMIAAQSGGGRGAGMPGRGRNGRRHGRNGRRRYGRFRRHGPRRNHAVAGQRLRPAIVDQQRRTDTNMKLTHYICALFLCLWTLAPAGHAQTAGGPALRGTITDPSGALVPGALVQLRGPGGEQRKTTGEDGTYSFPELRPGKYNVRVIAKGFTVSGRQDVEINGPMVLDAQLIIQADTQVLNVDDEANSVAADPTSNGSALVLREKELSALSDDPDELTAAAAGDGRAGRRSQRRTDLHRRLHRRQPAQQVVDSGSAHQLQSVFAGVRAARLRAHRDSDQAGNGHAARAGVRAVQQGSAELAQSAADAVRSVRRTGRICSAST